jgi:K+ potassium transporter
VICSARESRDEPTRVAGGDGRMRTIQCGGTARIGRMFGPIMLVWFGTIAVLGVIGGSRVGHLG